MADATSGAGARPSGRASSAFAIVWTLAALSGLGAMGLAVWGWMELLPHETASNWIDIAVRSIKSLLLSDIYFEPVPGQTANWQLEYARDLGLVFSLLVAVRLIIYALGERAAEIWFRSNAKGHDVIVGAGPAADEYARAHASMFGRKARAIRLASEWAPIDGRLATLKREGDLPEQLKATVAKRARRIVVDEGADSDTWETAHEVAKACPNAQVLAHISDPWMLDRLSREEPKYGLVAFSYSTGAARQAMLAHPPYLIARRYKAPAQHILIIGFGQVGQAVAREFLVTSAYPEPEPLMITVLDPRASERRDDFEGRHPELHTEVDFRFIDGDIRSNRPKLFDELKERFAKCEPAAVYIAIDDDHKPLSLAFAVRSAALQRELFRCPIFVCAQHGAGLASVKQGIGLAGIETAHEQRFQAENRAMKSGQLCDLRVVSFGAWPQAFDGAGLVEPHLDGQARRFHETYERLIARQAAITNPGQDPPQPTKWEDLSDQFRVANRRAAAHIRAKANVAGFDLNKWLETGDRLTHQLPTAGEKFRLDDPGFVSKMCELEHRRWMLDRFIDGWRKSPRDQPRDRYAKTHPDLVPFKDLTDASKAKDENVVLLTAQMLGAPAPVVVEKPKT